MNALSQFAAYLFASGDVFFVGAALVVVGRAATRRLRHHGRAKWLRLLTILGVILVTLSMVPLPLWLYGLVTIPPLLGLIESFRNDDQTRRFHMLHRAQPIVEFLLLAAMIFELVERHQLYAVPFPQMPTEVHVIGDSLSAGIAHEQSRLWPNLIAREWNASVRNHAQAGATTASAIRQADAVTSEDCLVLIEIGGNDFFERRPTSQIEADLNRLLTRLSSSRRTLVMFELPLPPTPGAYDLARLQRRLAFQHRACLIPRRDFAKVLLAPDATSDGLHLTPIGHRALASLVLSTLSPRR